MINPPCPVLNGLPPAVGASPGIGCGGGVTDGLLLRSCCEPGVTMRDPWRCAGTCDLAFAVGSPGRFHRSTVGYQPTEVARGARVLTHGNLTWLIPLFRSTEFSSRLSFRQYRRWRLSCLISLRTWTAARETSSKRSSLIRLWRRKFCDLRTRRISAFVQKSGRLNKPCR